MPKQPRFYRPSRQFWGLFVTLIVLFIMGGSSRLDVESLAIMNPLVVICCGAAVLSLRPEHCRDKMWSLALILLITLLIAIYLLPLPPKVLDFSSGTSVAAVVRSAADVSVAPQTLSMTPFTGRQSLFFVFAPLAVILFAVQLNRDDLRLALPLVIGIGAVSGIIGVLQLAGSNTGPLYFYRITNSGSAVGLFANRNHAAVFIACLFPMLAFFAAKSEARRRSGSNTPIWIATAIAILLVPLLLVTGSRSGMLSAVVGLSGGALLYVSSSESYRNSKTGKSAVPIWAVFILALLVALTIYFSRAEAIDRIFAENGTTNDRADFWASSLRLFKQYFPFGFGPGGFVQAFQIYEPLELLNGTYLNRLHNDWLEIILTYGVAGIAVMSVGAVYYIRRTFVLWMRMDGARWAVGLGRMASIVIAILAIASFFDYPMRTPSIAGFAALVLIWFGQAQRTSKASER